MYKYEIRPYKSSDKKGFLSLYETIKTKEKREDWFKWKYQENPYIDHVPIILGIYEGEVIGVRPLFAMLASINGKQEVVLQPGDAMVHPEHRRQGLFSQMMEQMIEQYSGEYPFYFTFPNNLSGPAHLKHGSKIVSERTSYYRFQNPKALATTYTDSIPAQIVTTLTTPLIKGYYHIKHRRTSTSTDLTIRKESEIPGKELSQLYQQAIPDKIHAVRDEQFYNWRFENPDWEYTTYLAEDKKGLKAAIVVGTSAGPGQTTTKLTDVVPLTNTSKSAVKALIDRILSDYTESDLVVAPPQGIPESVLQDFGFHPDTRPPVTLLTTQTTHVVRSLTDNWEHNGIDITDPQNWLLTFAEEDTS